MKLGNDSRFLVTDDVKTFNERRRDALQSGDLLEIEDVDSEGEVRQTVYVNPGSVAEVQDWGVANEPPLPPPQQH